MLIQHSRSLTELVYETIRSDILTCRYPPDTKLRINSLCKELDASLGAVREALSRLNAEGFVISEAQKGFTVAPVSLTDLKDLTQTRVTIEVLLIGRSIDIGGVQWEAEIVGAYHLMSRLSEVTHGSPPRPSEEWAVAHGRFHRALVGAADSKWLLRIRDMLFDQSDRYRRMTAATAKKDRDLNTEHREIMQAVLARDKKISARLIDAHFRKTAEVAARIIDQSETAKKAAPDRQRNLKRRRRKMLSEKAATVRTVRA